MLGLWPYIVADFLRDYGIDLSERKALLTISWRRFSTLLHGLSARGAVATHYDSVAKKERQEQGKGGNDPSADNFWHFIAMTSKPSGKEE